MKKAITICVLTINFACCPGSFAAPTAPCPPTLIGDSTSSMISSCNTGIDSENSRFVGSGGSDQNDGLSHATRWLTLNKVNASSLPAGTDLYILQDETLDETLICDWSGTSDDPIVLDTYYLDGTTPTRYSLGSGDARGSRAVIESISGKCDFFEKDNVLVKPWWYANAETGPARVSTVAAEDPGVQSGYDPAVVATLKHGAGQDVERSNDISAYAGSKSYKFNVLATSTQGRHRSEITTNGYDRFEAYTEDRTYWTGFSLYFPTNWPIDDQDIHNDTVVIMNTHQEVGDPEAAPAYGVRLREDGQFLAAQECSGCGQGDVLFSPARDVEDFDGAWVRFVVQFKASKDSDGVYKIWMNDTLVHDYSGQTVAVGTTKPFYFKWGLYPSYTIYREPDGDGWDEKVIYADELRIVHDGQGGGYEDVDPASWLTNTSAQ